MPIDALETHVIPALTIPERTFPNLWILDMVINGRAGSLQEATAYLNVAPSNSANGDLDLTAQREINIRLIDYLMIPGDGGGPNPLAIAMGAVEAAVPWVEAQIRAAAQRQAEADGLVSPDESEPES